MPLQIPTIDDRRYQELVETALARIPVYTPEYTNFSRSDPGVTLIEVFAFLTESLLYRSNLIPERNRMKFLQLLNQPLQPGTSARGLVTIRNERGPLETITLNSGLEVRSGQVPFRTTMGLDVLPIEAQMFFKRAVTATPQQLAYYHQLYASLRPAPADGELAFYETVPFPVQDAAGLNLATDTTDGSLWIALLARPAANLATTQKMMAGKTLSLGFVPAVDEIGRRLAPGISSRAEADALLSYEIPNGENLPALPAEREAKYRQLAAQSTANILREPGIVQLTLPRENELQLWKNLDPLEAGSRNFPPALEDTNLNERLITWVRVRSTQSARLRLLWAGINVTPIEQREEIRNEVLPLGTGEPDQIVVLAKTPVVPSSVHLTIDNETWQEMDDLLSAGPEVPAYDPRQHPGIRQPCNERVKVFRLNPESGEIFFGDGFRGARPPLNAVLRADYAISVGRAGNVNANAINTAPALPAGLSVSNPVATWGGADAETVGDGEKQITRYLQHRDRLVNAFDFKTIARRTPGIDLGRVEILPAFNPELGSNLPGDAPGAVTLMVIPRSDPAHPDAPEPDRIFLNAICEYLDPRRLVTTEVFLRGPVYRDIWLSVDIGVEPGRSIGEVTQAVRNELRQFLAPLPLSAEEPCDELDSTAARRCGWPLQKTVVALELMAQASRVAGVLLVNELLLAEGNSGVLPQVEMRGVELPRLAGISVTAGTPMPLNQLRGQGSAGSGQGGAGSTQGQGTQRISVPILAEECQ